MFRTNKKKPVIHICGDCENYIAGYLPLGICPVCARARLQQKINLIDKHEKRKENKCLKKSTSNRARAEARVQCF